ncbi:MAG TPA: ABC transporter ATP-binding protein [Actinoplanes sp.]|jgi:ABC-2 type transport system ATP-binding protein
MIEINDLTKTYGDKTAVDHLSVTVRPGVVTGFLGPNGAGKSTTMRVILGLDHPTGGETLVNGRRYTDHRAPLREVGALLEAKAFHPGRSAYHHLLALAATGGYGRQRVRQVLDMVGLEQVAGKRTRGFSMGMGQRLGIAAALLGDPAVVILDEPVNGLDPDGIRWIRGLLRGLAAEGRTVFVSSHLMSEMALTADHLVIVGRGRLIADVPTAEMTAASAVVRVRSPQAARLRHLLDAPGVGATGTRDELSVSGRSAEEIARVALANGVLVTELTPVHASLEDAYMKLTHNDVEYQPADITAAAWRAAA